MYGHPRAVNRWAKVMRPDADPLQVAQAALMRNAKQAKRVFLSRQLSIFERDGFAVTPCIPPFGESAD